MRCAWPVAALAVTAACVGAPSTNSDPDQPRHPGSVGELFASDTIWDVHLSLSERALADLVAEPQVYVEGSMLLGEVFIENVSIRLKGKYSFQNLGGKSSFKVRLNNFTDADRLGVETLTLNNMRQDRSQIHEWMGYRIFRELGLAAPRSGFARVYVNDVPYGLYANVETPDHRFLVANYADADGNLYEAPWTADLDDENVELFEQEEGTDKSRADLDAVVARLAEDSDGVFFGDDALIDSEQFMRFVAAEALVGHWDGYWKSNNYFIYHELETDHWTWLPWGFDMVLDRDLDPFTSAGLVAQKCWGLPSCVAEYSRVALELLDDFESLDVLTDVDNITALIEEAVKDDPRSPQPPDKVHRFWEMTRVNLVTAVDRLRPRLDCVVGGLEADRDGDGHGGCFADCDDASPLALPGGTEICDGLDNDCDGSIDEALCPCSERALGGTTYLMCGALVTWTEARDECVARGGQLAVLEGEKTSELLDAIASDIDPAASWFIGANDRGEERLWQTSLDVEMAVTHFAPGEPDDFGGQDCAVLASFAGGGWADEYCTSRFPYICEMAP